MKSFFLFFTINPDLSESVEITFPNVSSDLFMLAPSYDTNIDKKIDF